MTLEYVTYPDADDATKKIGVDRRTIGADMVEIQVVALDVAGDGQTPSLLAKGQASKANSLPVTLPSDADTLPVSGPLTNAELRAAAVPVSASSLPLPTSAATETTLGTVLKEGTDITGASMPSGGASGRGWLSAIWKAITDRLPAALGSNGGLKVEGVAGGQAVPVSGTFWQATQPVSGPLTDAQLRASVVPVSLPKGAKTFSAAAPDTTATVLLAANASRQSCTLVNNGAVTVYLGKANTVTTSNGLPLAAGATLSDDVSTDAWWGVTASGTGDIRVAEVA